MLIVKIACLLLFYATDHSRIILGNLIKKFWMTSFFHYQSKFSEFYELEIIVSAKYSISYVL
jgi:hypothetical protein